MGGLLDGAAGTGSNGAGLTRALAGVGSASLRSTSPPLPTESAPATDDPYGDVRPTSSSSAAATEPQLRGPTWDDRDD
jgi:hypothetical protein